VADPPPALRERRARAHRDRKFRRRRVAGVGVIAAALVGVFLIIAASGSDKNTGSGDSASPGSSASGPNDIFAGGQMLIADRGNNRLLLVNPQKKILWRYPGPGRPPPKGGFYFPDDAFFTHNGTGIISNQEENNTVVQISYPQGQVTFQYGHPRQPGSGPGFLHQPDDSYLLKDGTITVADALNCRILFLSPAGKRLSQIGSPGNCTHNPPRSINYPNGDTPLPNGNVLVSEVNGSYVDEFTRGGKLVWSTKLPISYPSDPQQLGPNRYLLADYAKPGGVFECSTTRASPSASRTA